MPTDPVHAFEAHACISLPPADCSDRCSHGPCDCSGKWRNGCSNASEIARLRKELAYIAGPLNESEPQVYFAAQHAAQALGGWDQVEGALNA